MKSVRATETPGWCCLGGTEVVLGCELLVVTSSTVVVLTLDEETNGVTVETSFVGGSEVVRTAGDVDSVRGLNEVTVVDELVVLRVEIGKGDTVAVTSEEVGKIDVVGTAGVGVLGVGESAGGSPGEESVEATFEVLFVETFDVPSALDKPLLLIFLKEAGGFKRLCCK